MIYLSKCEMSGCDKTDINTAQYMATNSTMFGRKKAPSGKMLFVMQAPQLYEC